MVRKYSSIIILLGAIAALGFALFSQYVQGFQPCEMCIWQRFVYVAVALFALIAIFPRILLVIAFNFNASSSDTLAKISKICGVFVSLLLASQIALAVFHAGVEQKWWEGLTTCSSSLGGSIEDLKAQIMGAPVIRCDEIAWKFLGLSMAAWNAVYAGVLFVVSLAACRKSI